MSLPSMLAKPGDGLAVRDGLLEGHGEAGGHQERELVFAVLRSGVSVAVPVDRHRVAPALGADLAPRVHTERTDLVFKVAEVYSSLGS